jgi:hypothetical protein
LYKKGERRNSGRKTKKRGKEGAFGRRQQSGVKRKKDFVLRKGKQEMGKNVLEKIATKERGEKYVKDKQRGGEKGSGKDNEKGMWDENFEEKDSKERKQGGGKRENER